MRTDSFDVTVSSDDYGLEQEELAFTYTEKEGDDWKVERYQLKDELGIIFSGEKLWRTEEKSGFLGLWRNEEEVYEEEVEKRVAYDRKRNSVVTEHASWDEFRKILQDTEAYQYLI